MRAEVPEVYPSYIQTSGWFGPITWRALGVFQEKYAQDILVPWGLTKGTSYMGKTTIAKLNTILSFVSSDAERNISLSTISQFFSYMEFNQSGDDIKHLQEFLRSQDNEIYPEGLVTGYFGSMTKRAVVRFQLEYGVIESEQSIGAGYVGPRTMAAINNILSTGK